MQMQILILLLIVFVSAFIKPFQRGGTPFTLLHSNLSPQQWVGKGVKGSYANIPNGPDPTKPQFYTDSIQVLPTHYGHGIPLKTTKPRPLWGDPITPHNLNVKCSIECCPSPYSCDHGCLCADQQDMRNRAFK